MSAEQPPPEAHDPTGGDLARSVARSYRDAGGRGSRIAGQPGRGGRGPRGALVREEKRSGPWPDERDPQSLERAMSRMVAEHGWTDDVAVHGLFSRWDTLVGGEVAQHCRPERFVDGALAVRADSTAWATGMRLLAPTVLQRLNDELGGEAVRRIEVRGPQAPSWRHGRFTVRGGRGPRDTYG